MVEAAAPIAEPAAGQRSDVPLAFYVHLPWCVKKCPYCDFNSHRAGDDLPEDAYVNALLADLTASVPADENRPVQSIFFGGGTPSLFSPAAIGRVIDAIAARLVLTDDCEITLEANPGASEHGRFADYRAAGVNRISIGVQSLDDALLKRLGRVHDARAALAAIDAVQAAGFTRMNCDLMFGLPGQALASAAGDVARIIERAPGHISYYQLTLEPGTAFYHRPPTLPHDDAIQTIFERSAKQLTTAGYRQYEVSAWAQNDDKGDAACAHNINYWLFGDYLAIGAGAHAKLTAADGRTITRSERLRWPLGYMQAAGTPAAITEQRTLDADDRRFEFLLGALRLQDGFTREHYTRRTGLEWDALVEALLPSIDAGLVDAGPERIRASARGWYYLDTILAGMLPDA